MSKHYITALLIIFMLFIPAFVIFADHPETIESERRTIAPFPKKPKSLSSGRIKRFFKEIDAYYNDRFPSRATIIALSKSIYEMGNMDMNPSKCYQGKENWLFLGNDYDRGVDTLTGIWKPSSEEIAHQVRLFTTIDRIVQDAGAEFHMLIGPNKSSVYPEYLPPLVIPAKTRGIIPQIAALKANGISIIDALNCLLPHKGDYLLYYRTDTHWNAVGAWFALDGFMRQTRIAVLPEVTFIPSGTYRGDLVDIGGYSTFPLKKGDTFTPVTNASQTAPLIDKHVLVLGDSFSIALMPYLKDIFKDVHSIRYNKLSIEKNTDNLVRYLSTMQEKPDIVLWVQVERIFARWGSR